MSLSKKKSRLIVINDNQYRWVLSPNDGFNVFVAEEENEKGRKIEVFINDMFKIITPKSAELIIRQALELDWNPKEKGSPIVYELIYQDKIEKRK